MMSICKIHAWNELLVVPLAEVKVSTALYINGREAD